MNEAVPIQPSVERCPIDRDNDHHGGLGLVVVEFVLRLLLDADGLVLYGQWKWGLEARGDELRLDGLARCNVASVVDERVP